MSLRKLREQKGMSQISLCKKSGINQSTLSQYENASRKPSMRNAKLLADSLGVSLDEIFDLFNIAN